MTESIALLGSAVLMGTGHTLIGPDHYLPFIAIAAARGWSLRKTAVVTILCGMVHVLGSVVIGLAGVAMGKAAGVLQIFESGRGEIAAWLMISFGLVYMVWGLRRAFRGKHGDFPDRTAGKDSSLVPFILFVIFVFGPCEPLIPLLIYPAAAHNFALAQLVSLVFMVATVATMTTVVVAASSGLRISNIARRFRFSHAVAGAVVMCGGLAIVFLGL